jgi:hypothetical protein
VSAIPHWLYLTPLRRHGPLWSRSVITLSLAGCVLAASGLIAGIWQAVRAGRATGARLASPYTGLMRWHHYAGLAFGLFTFTWVASGLLSLDPFPRHSSTEPTREQGAAVAGGPIRLDELTLERLRAAGESLAAAGSMTVKRLELVRFRSQQYLIAHGVSRRDHERVESALVSVLDPERGAFARFGDDEVIAAARAAMPATPLIDAMSLESYDSYYYDIDGTAPLPMVRARFGDAARTWLYLDPSVGAIVRREDRSSRLNRWLYHGLHSFDFPFFAGRRVLRDVVVVLLSAGGLLVAFTSMRDGWRRARRRLR